MIPLTLTKASILFFYRRIFTGPTFFRIVWATLVVVLAWGISFFFTLLFLCTPTNLYVTQGAGSSGVTCTNEAQVYYSLSISDFLIDFIILAIPIPFVWRLHMMIKHKVAVTAVFLLGCLLVCRNFLSSCVAVQAKFGGLDDISMHDWRSCFRVPHNIP